MKNEYLSHGILGDSGIFAFQKMRKKKYNRFLLIHVFYRQFESVETL